MKAIITAGPTYEPIDPVRFIGNRSSGKQGYAIAAALRDAGYDVTLISGPTALPDPQDITTFRVKTAQEMLDATLSAFPADIAICTAAVSDWSPVYSDQKIKKTGEAPTITLKENPDILQTIATHKHRPQLVIGFAAETENLLDNAHTKRTRKNCDAILANDVSQNVFGADENHVYLITQSETQDWHRISKTAIAEKLLDWVSKQ